MSLLRRKQAGPAATDPAVASHFDALIAAAAVIWPCPSERRRTTSGSCWTGECGTFSSTSPTTGRAASARSWERPFVGVADGKPFVFAFTDPRRAHAFAAKNDLTQGPGAYATLSMRMPAAARYVGKLKDHGVFGILFNDGPNGFFAPLANVDPMLQHFYA